MNELEPVDDVKATGFTSILSLDNAPDESRPAILNVLNTGATFSVVQRDSKSDDSYLRAQGSLQDAGAHPCA